MDEPPERARRPVHIVVHQVADRVVVLRQGRIAETGGVGAVCAVPALECTHRLLDAVPVPSTGRRRRGGSVVPGLPSAGV
ncbi:hypothetical protein [Nocardia sp. NPDC058497]|uniref:hypothetical protein n=1 Tax=Nocardia sp. NPDC058497 TaxID=3346529 RepID=UPI00365FE2A2